MDNQNWINLTLWFVSGVASGFLLYGPLKFILEQFHQINQKFEETNAELDDVKEELGQLDEVKSRLEHTDQELDVLKSQIEDAVDDAEEELGQFLKSQIENQNQNMRRIEDRLRRLELGVWD